MLTSTGVFPQDFWTINASHPGLVAVGRWSSKWSCLHQHHCHVSWRGAKVIRTRWTMKFAEQRSSYLLGFGNFSAAELLNLGGCNFFKWPNLDLWETYGRIQENETLRDSTGEIYEQWITMASSPELSTRYLEPFFGQLTCSWNVTGVCCCHCSY